MRMTVATAVACLVAGVSLAAVNESPGSEPVSDRASDPSKAALKTYELSIPRQSLDLALKDLAQQTGFQIARMSDMVDGTAMVGPVSGSLTTEEALKSLLKAQALSYRVV